MFEQSPIPVLYVVQPKRTENSGLVVPTSICLINYVLTCHFYCNTYLLALSTYAEKERLVPIFRCMPILVLQTNSFTKFMQVSFVA